VNEVHALSDDEVVFSEVFRRAPDVMSIVRISDALILEINDAFEEASGLTREQILGHSSRDFPWWPNAEQRDAILTQLRLQGRLQDIEARFSTPHGELVYLISARPILYRGEHCAIWRAANVTEQRHMEQANRALEERLRQKQNLERLGLLAGGIAHDFNNLLVGVLGNAELVLATLGHDVAQRPLLEALAKSAQRMSDHTRELLDYAGHTALAQDLVQLDVLVDEAQALARRLLEPTVELHVAQRARPAWVRGNAGQLTRMLINLIKHAAENLEDGYGSVWVDVSRGSEQVVVSIRDSGRGMDAGTEARMFDPFFSTKLTGHGLGLASVPGIVERHGGSLAVESERGRGTRVTISIPEHAPAPRAAAPSGRPQRWSGRALVVDDEATVRAVSRALLERLGFEVSEAADGESALRIVQDEQRAFRLILLDANMPGLDGAQTLARLRVFAPELPVLLCSGYSAAEFAPLLEQKPHIAFLTKPFRAAQLASSIEALMASGA
jgi:two-component system cell cycle sensor histidine kinase/response regulator CckA